jgi:hypothetical protein
MRRPDQTRPDQHAHRKRLLWPLTGRQDGAQLCHMEDRRLLVRPARRRQSEHPSVDAVAVELRPGEERVNRAVRRVQGRRLQRLPVRTAPIGHERAKGP